MQSLKSQILEILCEDCRVPLERIAVMTGAALGMMMPCGRQSMKTQVGKSIHKLGVVVDNAVDNIVSEMR